MICGQRNCWYNLGWWWWPSQRSKVSRGHNNKQFSLATKLGQKSNWCKFRRTVTSMKVKGQQRSSTENKICPTYMIFGEYVGRRAKSVHAPFVCVVRISLKGYYVILKGKKSRTICWYGMELIKGILHDSEEKKLCHAPFVGMVWI